MLELLLKILNPKNYLSPIDRIYEYQFFYLNMFGFSDQRLYYTNTFLSTDDGWIWENFSNKTYLQFHNQNAAVGQQRSDNLLYYFSIYLHSSEINHYRTYIKVQTLAAILGGFMKLIIVFTRMVLSFYLQNSYYLFLYNTILNLEIDFKEDVVLEERDNNILNNTGNNFNNINKINKNDNNKGNTCIDKYIQEIQNINSINNALNSPNASNSPNSPNASNSPKLPNYPKTPSVVFEPSKINSNNEISLLNYPNNNYTSIDKDNKINSLINSKSKENLEFNYSNYIKYNNLTEIIAYKVKKKTKVIIDSSENFYRLFCCWFIHKIRSENDFKKLRYELVIASEQEVNRRLNGVNMINRFDQFNLFKKLILNKNQCTMLENRDLMVITNKPIFTNDEFKNLHEDKEKAKLNNLVKYLKERCTENNLSNIDIMLYKYLKLDIRESIEKELNGLQSEINIK